MYGLLSQIVINGLMAGVVYILMALGFTLIFGIMRVVNFAHGEFYMVGAALIYGLYGLLGVNYFVCVVIATVAVGLMGGTIERLLFRPFIGKELNGMIMALALAITLQAAAFIVLGSDELAVDRPVSGIMRLGGAIVPLDRLAVGGGALAALGFFYVFLRYTKLGLAMRAVAQDQEIASLQGIRPKMIHPLAFAMGTAFAGFAGALMAPIYTINPYMGILPMLKAFVVVILGGLGSIPGAVLGGLLIGITESVFATMINTTVATMISFGLVGVIIIFRPKGLLGS